MQWTTYLNIGRTPTEGKDKNAAVRGWELLLFGHKKGSDPYNEGRDLRRRSK